MAIFWLSTFLINSDHVYQSILSRFCLCVTPFNEMHRCDDHPIKTMGISELRSWQSQGLQPPSLELPSWHAPPACQARGCEGADAGWAVESGLPIHTHTYIYSYMIEGSLEVKLPTIWTDEKQSWAEAGRREEQKREDDRRERESEERRCRCAKR